MDREEDQVTFFGYSVRIGRQIMLSLQRSQLTRLQAWLLAGLSLEFL